MPVSHPPHRPALAEAVDGPGRLLSVDVARGIGIVLVVYGHVLRANIVLVHHPLWALQDRTIYAFHMPLFFVLSGLFLGPSLARGRRAFVAARGWQLVYPYLLWSGITVALELAMAPHVNSPLSLRDALLAPIVPVEQYWFLYVLFFAQLVVAAVWPRRWLLALVALAALVGGNRVDLGPLSALPREFPFVAIGVLAGPRVLALFDRSAGLDAAVMVAGFGALALVLRNYGDPAGAASGYVLLAGLAGTVGVMGLAALVTRTAWPAAVLGALGRDSMAIYVSHTIFSAGSRVALKLVGIAPDSPLSLGACFAAGLVGPLLLVHLIAPHPWRRWAGLGLAPPRRSVAPSGEGA